MSREWRRRAACAGIPIEHFFQGAGSSVSPGHRACLTCPVLSECLVDALNDPDVTEADKSGSGGIRGGLRSRDRHLLRQQISIALSTPIGMRTVA